MITPAKILSPSDVEGTAARARASGRTLVLATGCFDVLHVGHVRLLTEARAQGDLLFVCVNDDAGVRRLKGTNRPVNPGWARCEMLAALRVVDFISQFSEPTPEATIRRLRPHVFVKGGDYTLAELPEAAVLSQIGARLHLVHHVPSFSTTAILTRTSGPLST